MNTVVPYSLGRPSQQLWNTRVHRVLMLRLNIAKHRQVDFSQNRHLKSGKSSQNRHRKKCLLHFFFIITNITFWLWLLVGSINSHRKSYYFTLTFPPLLNLDSQPTKVLAKIPCLELISGKVSSESWYSRIISHFFQMNTDFSYIYACFQARRHLFLYKWITTHQFDGVQCVNGQTLNEESCPPLLI